MWNDSILVVMPERPRTNLKQQPTVHINGQKVPSCSHLQEGGFQSDLLTDERLQTRTVTWRSNRKEQEKRREPVVYLPMGPGGRRGWGRLTGVELRACARLCSSFGVALSRGESLVLVIGNVSALFGDSSDSSSSPSADTPEDEGLDASLWSTSVLLGVTGSGVPLFKLISPFSSDSLSITSDAISQESPVARSQSRLEQKCAEYWQNRTENFLWTLCG